MTATTFTLTRPDDWHVHLREGPVLRTVLPYTASQFGRAIVMPNLKLPVTTSDRAQTYRDEIIAALPRHLKFQPLMTLYLTDSTSPDDVALGYRDGIVSAVKLYPAHATTNSEFGISSLKTIYPVLECMQKVGVPLLIHGEVTDQTVDVFDREAVFIERHLIPLRRDFPSLKIVLEHITTAESVSYVMEEGARTALAATITPHHLHLNRNAIFTGGIRPHYYCLPILKREKHRLALIKAATSGKKMFFLGTDTAPHDRQAKECDRGCAGIFCAPNALGLYAQIFDQEGCLDRLEGFSSLFGPQFYGLLPNTEKITLKKYDVPSNDLKSILTEDGQQILSFVPLSPVAWTAT